MGMYRKKPVVIEAFQVHPDDNMTRRLPPKWLIEKFTSGNVTPLPDGGLLIATLEGEMRADVGDWIIKGVKGELYPCKPDIFDLTYEPV